MSGNQNQGYEREIKHLWETYSSAPDTESFVSFCRTCLKELKSSKKIIKKKDFKSALSYITDALISNYINSLLVPSEFLDKLSPILNLVQEVSCKKEFELTIDINLLKKIFDLLEHVLSQQNPNDNDIYVKICMRVLAIVEDAVKFTPVHNDINCKLFVNILSLLENLVRSPINNLSLIPVNFNEHSRSTTSNEDYTDIFIYLLQIQLLLANNLSNILDFRIIYPVFNSTLLLIKSNTPLLNHKLEVSSILASKKFTLVIQILKSLSKKTELCIEFIKETKDKFKELFILSVILHLKSHHSTADSFLKDSNDLARLFRVTLSAFKSEIKVSTSVGSQDSMTTSYDGFFYINDIPMVMFTLLFSSEQYLNEENVSDQARNTLKRYVLEFINELYFDFYYSSKSSGDIAIQDILLSKDFFQTKDSVMELLWNQIWSKLTQKTSNYKFINRSISEVLKKNIDSDEYLNKFNTWINEYLENKPKYFIELIKKGLVNNLLKLIVSENKDISFSFFQIIYNLIKMSEQSVVDFRQPLETILSHILPISKNFQDYCEPLIEEILVTCNDKITELFLDNCKSQMVGSTTESLLNALLKAFNHTNFKNYMAMSKFEVEFFEVFNKCLPKTEYEQETMISLWTKSLNLIASTVGNSYLYTKNQNFNFWQSVLTFRLEIYNKLRLEIINHTIDIVISLISDPDTKMIVFPMITPLFIEYLCISYDLLPNNIQFYLTILFSNVNNLEILAKNGFISVVLQNINAKNDINWVGYSDIVSKIISIEFKLLDFNYFVKTIQVSTHPIRLTLLKILLNALKPRQTPALMRDFIEFDGKSSLKKDYKHENIQLKDEFSISIWLYLETPKKSLILSLKLSKNTISIYISNFNVLIYINDITLETKQKISSNKWNLLTFNYQVSGILKNNKIIVYIDDKLAEFREKKNFKLSSKNLISEIKIGASEDFKGKISQILIFKKSLDTDYQILMCNVSFKYTLIKFPNSIDTEKAKALKDLRDMVILDVLDDIPSTKDRNWNKYSNLYHTINAYSLKRLLVELCESLSDYKVIYYYNSFSKKDDLEFLSILYQIFLFFIKTSPEDTLIDKEFVEYFAYTVKTNPVNSEICDTYHHALRGAAKKSSNILLKTFISTPELVEFSSKTQFFTIIIQKYKEMFLMSKENIYQFCSMIKTLEEDNITYFFRLFIGTDTEELRKDDIGYVLQAFIDSLEYFKDYSSEHSKEYSTIKSVIKSILRTISEFDYDYSYISITSIVLLHLIEKINDFWIQNYVIDAFILNNRRAQEKIKPESEKNIIETLTFLLDEVLPQCLCKETVNLLLTEGYHSTLNPKKISYLLIDIVMKRIESIDDADTFDLIFDTIKQNKESIIDCIFRRNIFPDWLSSYCMKSNNSRQALELVSFIFIAGFSYNEFASYAKFIEDLNSLEIYSMVLEQIVDYKFISFIQGAVVNISSYLKVFRVFHKQEIKNLKAYEKCFELIQNSESLFRKLSNSMDDIKIVRYSYSAVFNEIHPKINIGEGMLVDYIKCLIFGLKIFKNNKMPFKYFKLFLEHPEINYFSKYNTVENPDLVNSENFLCIYFFSEVIQLYYEQPEDYIQEIEDFIEKSNFFDKLKDFLWSKRNKDILIDALQSSILDENREIDRMEIDKQVALSYKSLIETQEPFISILKPLKTSLESFLNTNEWLINYKIILKLINPLKNSDLIQKRPDSPSFTDKKDIPDLHLLEQHIKTPWVKSYLEEIDRNNYKQAQNYQKFKLNLAKVQRTLYSTRPENIKIRQTYDKFYRWAIIKPAKFIYSSYNTPNIEQNFIFPIPETQNVSEINSWSSFTESKSSNASVISPVMNLRKSTSPVYSVYVERIKVQGSYFGKLNLGNDFIEFINEGEVKPDTEEFSLGALEFTRLQKTFRVIFKPSEILEVIQRRFVHQHTALEIILRSGKSYFFNFFNKIYKTEAMKIIAGWKKVKLYTKSRSELELVTNDWKKGAISNFEYLMILNLHSGRSNNDLTQYPVFPWVVTEFEKETLDYNDASIYRNFKNPIGAQTETGRNIVTQKYSNWKETEIAPFHYGSHYSNSGIVLHYLLRLEPYTSQCRALQGGRFDVADRLFSSLSSAWDSCSTSGGGDVKELIPELFFNPHVLNSYSKQLFGITQTGVPIMHVQNPNWAVSAWDFVIKHRFLLESSITSRELNNWIDLVFGYKQHGKNAVQALNVFCYTSYEKSYKEFCKNHEKSEIEAITQQVYHFGQTPVILFSRKPHVARDEVLQNYTLRNFFYSNQEKDLIYNRRPKSEERSGYALAVFNVDKRVIMIKSYNEKLFIVKCKFKETNEIPVIHKEFVIQHYSRTIECHRKVLIEESLLDVQIQYTTNTFAVTKHDYLISGLDRSNSLLVHNFKGELIDCLFFHTDLITSVACASDYLFSGSLDSSVVSWKLNAKKVFKRHLVYFGHSSCVMHIKALDSYQLLFTSSIQKLILIHDIRTAECLNKIDEFAHCFDVCELGVLGLFNLEYVRFYGINGELISETKVYDIINNLKFSETGEFLIEFYNKCTVIRDIVKPDQERVIEIDNVLDCVSRSFEKIFYLFNSPPEKNHIFVHTYKLMSSKKIKGREHLINELI
jgi:Beige/BEACH domain/PH domain associated with Beige/BEACH